MTVTLSPALKEKMLNATPGLIRKPDGVYLQYDAITFSTDPEGYATVGFWNADVLFFTQAPIRFNMGMTLTLTGINGETLFDPMP